MPSITNEFIRDTAVACVEGFLNDRTPLNDGLAKFASEMELNAEQIKRCVETTNSVCHLKIASMAEDKTFEFPLASYDEVLARIAVPTGITIDSEVNSDVSKTAGVAESDGDGFAAWDGFGTKNSREMQLFKVASMIDREVETLTDKAYDLAVTLQKHAAELKKDKELLEKIATVSMKHAVGLTTIIFGEAKDVEDTGLFRTAELTKVANFVELYEQGQELVARLSKARDLQKEAGLQKEAMFGAMGKMTGTAVKGIINTGMGIAGGAKAMVNNRLMGKPGSKVIGGAVKAGLYMAGGAGIYKSKAISGTDPSTGNSKSVWNNLQGN